MSKARDRWFVPNVTRHMTGLGLNRDLLIMTSLLPPCHGYTAIPRLWDSQASDDLISTTYLYGCFSALSSIHTIYIVKSQIDMPFLSYKRALQLRHELQDTRATIITPDDEGYPELISRWSEACEKEAVRWHSSLLPQATLRRFTPWCFSAKLTLAFH